jgi:(p)ppGpp synthase/HD superfamily hydrolase
MYSLKWELEDLAFKYLYPEEYRDIVSLYQIDSIETFDNPGYTTGAIMIALVTEVVGLETFLEQWEVM